MNIFEIVSAIALIIACVFIIVVVLVKDTKSNMSQAISGGSSDNFFQKNAGRTKEARLNRTTVVATAVFFILALVVNIINVHSKPATTDTDSGSSVTESVSSDIEDESDITVDESSSTAEDDVSSAESETESNAESETSTESESAASDTDSAVSESDSGAADESAAE